MARILCVWLPQWPLQRVRQDMRRRGETPLPEGVYELNQRGVCCLIACSAATAARGVEVGMPVAEADALVRREAPAEGSAPRARQAALRPRQAALRAADFAWRQEADRWTDRETLRALADWCAQFSPQAALEETLHPECLFLEIGSVASLFGGEEALLSQIDSAFVRRGYQVRLAVGESVGAAWAAAHYADFPSDSAWLAIPAGQTIAVLAGLPLVALRLSSAIVERLHHLGVTRLGQVLALPRDALRARFGDELLRRLDQALGVVEEPIDCQAPQCDFSASWDAPVGVCCPETLDAVLEKLCEKTSQSMSGSRLGAMRVAVRLMDEQGGGATLEVGMFQPSADPRHWHGLLALQWERLRLEAGVLQMELAATRVETLVERQGRLFEELDEADDSQRQWGRLLERLAGRLGRQAVVQPRLLPEPQPERAWRWSPLVGGELEPSPARGSTGTRRHFTAWQRPLWALARPQAIETRSPQANGPPRRFRWCGQWYDVIAWVGPERIETGWWRRWKSGVVSGVRRDYWRVETSDRRRWWLVCDLRTGQWGLQGKFA
ncbi:MAG: DNA polymerase Y family protein [Planctomycetales bacterium]|nr:DNA polymerase Y family protein [Planctomycetales bacterium]